MFTEHSSIFMKECIVRTIDFAPVNLYYIAWTLLLTVICTSVLHKMLVHEFLRKMLWPSVFLK